MDNLINGLPNNTSDNTHRFGVYHPTDKEGNVCTTSQVAAAKAKGWTPLYYDGKQWKEYAGSELVVEINETNFPDANFRSYLLSQSYGADGKITESEIKHIVSINVNNKGIISLKGVEYFTALTWLGCNGNKLTALDVSKNTALTVLNCNDNQLTTLDVSKNTALEYLYCNLNQIKGTDMDNLINGLPNNTSDNTHRFGVYHPTDKEGNVCTTSQVAAAKAKGWTPLYYDGTGWKEYAGSEPTGIDVVKVGDTDVKIFSLDGKAQSKLQKGVNVVRMSNGVTKKVVVK